MASYEMQLPEAALESITEEQGRYTLHFSKAFLIKTIEGAEQKTRWYQAIDIVIDEAEMLADSPAVPATLKGGDIEHNIYTYRDAVAVPMDVEGSVGCELTLDNGGLLHIMGKRMQLKPLGDPRYIEHISQD